MILAPATVLPACARVVSRTGSYTYHRVSEPIRGALPQFRIDRAIPGRRR